VEGDLAVAAVAGLDFDFRYIDKHLYFYPSGEFSSDFTIDCRIILTLYKRTCPNRRIHQIIHPKSLCPLILSPNILFAYYYTPWPIYSPTG
jgi:hypothetical protein